MKIGNSGMYYCYYICIHINTSYTTSVILSIPYNIFFFSILLLKEDTVSTIFLIYQRFNYVLRNYSAFAIIITVDDKNLVITTSKTNFWRALLTGCQKTNLYCVSIIHPWFDRIVLMLSVGLISRLTHPI